jgi:chemotaxis protein methyltransferase CheR
MFKVNINETNIIIQIVLQKGGIDLSGMAMASMRLKISKFCTEHHFHTPDDLISCLQNEPGFINLFLSGIYSSSPGMFRDPELWIILRDEVLPELAQDDFLSSILVPDCVSSEEILSLAILLEESGMDQQFSLNATCVYDNIREQIKNKPLSISLYKNCQDNYIIFNPKSSLDRYFKLHKGAYRWKSELINPVEIMVQREPHDVVTSKTKLILYRNRLIYYNLETCHRRIERMLDPLADGTIIIIGIKESFKHMGLQHRLHPIYPDLNIYAKAR